MERVKSAVSFFLAGILLRLIGGRCWGWLGERGKAAAIFIEAKETGGG